MVQNHKVNKAGSILTVSNLINFSSNRETSHLFSRHNKLVRSSKCKNLQSVVCGKALLSWAPYSSPRKM